MTAAGVRAAGSSPPSEPLPPSKRSGTGPDGDRLQLVGCLRQGLTLARDFAIEPGRLAEAVWGLLQRLGVGADRPDRPSHSPTGKRGRWPTPANAVVDMPAAPARRRHEHREHTVGRLAEVLDTGPPAVSMAAVIGVPHESHGEEVKACVVLNPGADLTEDQLIAWCKQAMATYKSPAWWSSWTPCP
jgi:hypothetical protein